MQKHAQEGVPHISNKPCVSGTYTYESVRILAVGFASKKYHPLKDFKPAEWKRRNIHTEYYTTNLHTGAFMLPKYVEELLEQEEER